MKTIGAQVKSIIDDSAQPFNIIKGLSFNHRETINRIYFYKNDKFVECSDENAIFWNVVKPYIAHGAKNIDLDPKDFRAIGRGTANHIQSWILGIRFNKWADENNLSVKIDDLTQLVYEFGSFVWKLVDKDGKEDIEPCDLRNLYFDPSVKNIKDTNIVELHYLTDEEIRAKSDIWDNTEEIIKMAYNDKDNKNKEEFEKKEIWEYTGYVGAKDEKKKYKHVIGAGYGEEAIIAFEEEAEKDKCKYFDFHLDKYSGSWLRKGAYQTNFVIQERANTLVNENAASSAIASLLLLRSNDPNTKGNVLRGAISGQIITSADLQQIGIDNRSAGVLLNELDRIEAQVRKNLMLPDVATGDQLPSGTTFRGQALMSNASKSAFKQMRNRIAEPLKDVIQEYILPSLVKGWNREELLDLAGDEDNVAMYDEAVKNIRRQQMQEMNPGLMMTPEVSAALDGDTEQQLEKQGRKIDIGKKFFNFEYGFTIDPTGETYDLSSQNDAIIQALTLVIQAPTIADTPAFAQLLENNGLTAFKLKPEQKQEMMMAGQMQAPQQPMQSTLNQSVDTNV
jgi:hypothetical protein